MSTFVPLTTFYLLRDINIDVSYNNQYYFHEWKTSSDQYNFFYNKRFKTVNSGTYQRKNRNTISIPFQADEIRECKYIMWQNANYTNKWYYAFVTSIDYVNPNVSLINYQLDVFQTYYFEIKNAWKSSFIERMHTDRWTVNGDPVINTVPENLEIGSSYRVLDRKNLYQIPDVSFIVIGMTKSLTGTNNQLVSNVPAVIRYYFVPVSLNRTKYLFMVNYLGDNEILSAPEEVLNTLFYNDAYVNSVVSVYLMPYLPVNNADLSWTYRGTTPTGSHLLEISHPDMVLHSTSNLALLTFNNDFIPKPWEMTSNDKYSSFPVYEESKLLMHPFSFTEMSTDRGQVFLIKNEYVNGQNIKVGCFASITSMNKMSFIVKNYLNSGNINNAKIRLDPHSAVDFSVETYTQGYVYENGVNETGTSEMPIVDDYTASYMQSHRNSINVANNNAQLQYNQDLRTAESNRKVSDTEIQRDIVTGITKTVTQAVSAGVGIIGGTRGENVNAGMVANGIQGIVQAVGTGVSTAASVDASSKIRDINYSLATDIAGTNFQKETASIMAGVQDAQQIPPSVSTMGSEYVYDIAYWRDAIYLYPKTLLPEYASKVTDYFRKYGYNVNINRNPEEVTCVVNNEAYNHFDNRKSWNYIKIREPILNANIPMDDLMAIKGIFMKGVTLWHGDYVGDYGRNNSEWNGYFPHTGNTAKIRCVFSPSNEVTGHMEYTNGTVIPNDSYIPLGTTVKIVMDSVGTGRRNYILVNGLPIPDGDWQFKITMNTLVEVQFNV